MAIVNHYVDAAPMWLCFVDSIETVEYGKFVHIMDIEGNKIELWEPNDIEYEKLGAKMGTKTTK